MPNSIVVNVGQKVKQGEVIARCGNSGNSSEPHIHFQIQDGGGFFTAVGLPVQFSDISITENLNYKLFDRRPIMIEMDVDTIKNLKHIRRGQTVTNNLQTL